MCYLSPTVQVTLAMATTAMTSMSVKSTMGAVTLRWNVSTRAGLAPVGSVQQVAAPCSLIASNINVQIRGSEKREIYIVVKESAHE